MEAKIQRHGDITVVQLRGQIDLEKNQNFRQFCLRQLADKKVIFCLEGLQFVGSSGIQVFFRTLQDVHARNKHGIKVSGLKPDFLRVFRYTAVSDLDVHETSDFAVRSFQTGIPSGFTFTETVPVADQVADEDSVAGDEPFSS